MIASETNLINKVEKINSKFVIYFQYNNMEALEIQSILYLTFVSHKIDYYSSYIKIIIMDVCAYSVDICMMLIHKVHI